MTVGVAAYQNPNMFHNQAYTQLKPIPNPEKPLFLLFPKDTHFVLTFYFTGTRLQVRLQPFFSDCWESRWKQRSASHAVCLCFLGNTYKYQAGNRMNALLWFKHLSAACQSNRQQVKSHTKTQKFKYQLLFYTSQFVFFPRCQPIWCRSSDWRQRAQLKEGDEETGEGWGWIQEWKLSLPWTLNADSLTRALASPHSPATTALTSVPCVCLQMPVCVCEPVCVDESGCFSCVDYWTRTCTTALVSVCYLFFVSLWVFSTSASRSTFPLLSTSQTLKRQK